MTTGTYADYPLIFAPIDLAQMEQAETIRSLSGSTLDVYTFVSLFSWRDFERYEICFAEDAFLVKRGAAGDNAYLFPCGTQEGRKKLIDNLLTRERPVFYSVTDEDRLFLENAYPGRISFEDCRDEYPYLYDKDAQIALEGKEYKSLRHQVNIGRSAASEWTTVPMTGENVSRAIAMTGSWAENRDPGDLADTVAAETALSHFDELSMWGLLFQADGADIAYVAGTFITPELFDIAFCKVLDKRCDCFIKWLLYRTLPPEVRTVDSEDDMGLAGLRTHKLLRRPKELKRVWKGSFII